MRAAVLALVAGCSFQHGQAPGGGSDAAAGDGGDPPDTAPCVTYSTVFDTCATGPSLPTMPVDLPPGKYTYDTGTGTLTTPTGDIAVPHVVVSASAGELDVWFVDSFTLQSGATLRAVGSRGFAIASQGAIQIAGVLDLNDGGAGHRNDALCGPLAGEPGDNDGGGAGGGGGGGFRGSGGDGSDGNADGQEKTDGGDGGDAASARPASPIGGCRGGKGGNGNGTLGGQGGSGGGAVYLASALSIAVPGVIDAGGGGGLAGGNNGEGGGGGGSGGMIVLEAATVTVNGILAANGGGGGEGNTNGIRGENGRRDATRAAGGAGGDFSGGDGGDGGAGGTLNGATTNDVRNGGGGGGGGGVGFIAISGSPATNGGTISPALQVWP